MSGIPQTLDRSGIENQMISNFEFFDQRPKSGETDVASGLGRVSDIKIRARRGGPGDHSVDCRRGTASQLGIDDVSPVAGCDGGIARQRCPLPHREIGSTSSPPLSEWHILYFQVLSGDDRFTNTVHWVALAGCGVLASLIAKESNSHLPIRVLAATITVTLPMGLVQEPSSQGTLIGAFWLLAFVVFTLQYLQRPTRVGGYRGKRHPGSVAGERRASHVRLDAAAS